MMFRVQNSDVAGRWRAGELGKQVPAPAPGPDKYELWLDLGDLDLPPGVTLFDKPLTKIARVFGFFASEVDVAASIPTRIMAKHLVSRLADRELLSAESTERE